MFYYQLEKLCRQHNITPTAVTLELGLSKGTMSNWKKGATPNGEVVVRFAERFGVSTDYLLKGGAPLTGPEFDDPALKELVTGYLELDELERKVLLGKAAELLYYRRRTGSGETGRCESGQGVAGATMDEGVELSKGKLS